MYEHVYKYGRKENPNFTILTIPAYSSIITGVMNTSIAKAKEYGDILKASLGIHLRRIMLFGSRARGDAGDESDYDLLVIVDNRTHAVRESVLDAGVEMLNRYDQVFGAVLYNENEWQDAKRFPFGWNVENEGIAI